MRVAGGPGAGDPEEVFRKDAFEKRYKAKKDGLLNSVYEFHSGSAPNAEKRRIN